MRIEMWIIILFIVLSSFTSAHTESSTVTEELTAPSLTSDYQLTSSQITDNQSTTETPFSEAEEEPASDAGTKQMEDELTKLDQTLNAYLRKELHRLSKVLKEGDSKLQIPVLDPLKLEDQIVKPMVSEETFDVHLRNIWIFPLSSFQVRELESEIRESRIRLALYFPRLTTNCDIETNGTLFDIFNIHGRGNATIEFYEVHARTMIYLTRENNKLKVTMADQPFVDFKTSRVKFQGNEREGRKIVSTTVASQFGSLFFWLFSTNIVDIIDYYMERYVNDALSKFDTPFVFNSLSIPVRYLRVHVPHHPVPYAYISPVYFHPNTSS